MRCAPHLGANLQEYLGHDAPEGLGRRGIVRLLHEVQNEVARSRIRHPDLEQDSLQGHPLFSWWSSATDAQVRIMIGTIERY